MPPWIEPYVMCFVPLFAAMDPIGIAPFYVATLEKSPAAARGRVRLYVLATAGAVGLAFLFLGKGILALVGVTVADFEIAGGLLLLAIAVTDLVSTGKGERRAGVEAASPEEALQSGVVPIGVPLLVGPATITTLIVLLNAHGLVPTLTMFVLNIAVVGVVFWQSERLLRIVGRAGARAMGKIASLLLAAIAVKLVRLGIEDLMAGYAAAAP